MGRLKLDNKILFLGLAILAVFGLIGFFMYRQAVFSKDVLHLEVTGPTEAVMGQEIQYTVTYKNNGNFALEKPKLEFELPDNSMNEDSKLLFVQDIGTIAPGQGGVATFKARLIGKEGDVKTARARLSYMPHNLSARYESDAGFTTTINSVPLTLAYTMPPHALAGSEFDYSVSYASMVDYPLENMSIKLEPVSGFSVTSAQPLSLDKIEWKLPVLQKSQSGQIAIKGMISPAAPNNLAFSATLGMWQNGTFVVVQAITQSVAIDNSQGSSVQPSATITMTQKVLRTAQDGFENSGPVPPQVGQATTYIVSWQVHNDKAVNNVVVKATLPPNVTIGDEVMPDSEISRVSFDGASHQISWSLGTMAPNTTTPLSFQITIIPTMIQKGTFASLIGTVGVTGQDQPTGIVIQSSAAGVNTSLPDDRANSGGGVVQ